MPPAIEATVNPKRVRTVTGTQQPKPDGDCVIYWMSRDQRADDNWAMLHARQLALAQNLPLVVLFSLVPRFLSATIRQYGFMLRGLKETASTLRGVATSLAAHIPSHLFDLPCCACDPSTWWFNLLAAPRQTACCYLPLHGLPHC